MGNMCKAHSRSDGLQEPPTHLPFPQTAFTWEALKLDLTAATSIAIPQLLFFVVKKQEVDPPQMLTGVPESQLCSLHEHLVSWGPCKATRQEAVPAERGLCY